MANKSPISPSSQPLRRTAVPTKSGPTTHFSLEPIKRTKTRKRYQSQGLSRRLHTVCV
ncbi:hypothetical protein HOLleu_09784 [Holothuria leucospilota]|uniref:Uncharacterized protein n=1 Tax=Holothuria leucospilota TaxID=206669 RepID=A0A9Q1CCR4_HOLLE|nr:hypothetical protein HOLleu_09784 [Holothuria leucospilota]